MSERVWSRQRWRQKTDQIFRLLYFNLVAINLFELTEGPLHSHMSEDERYKSMIDYIVLPASFIEKVNSCVAGE